MLRVAAEPWHRSIDRMRRQQEDLEEAADEEADEDNDDDIQALIDVGEAEGIIEEEERALIHSVFEFGDKLAGEVMTPRTAIVALPNTATAREACDVMLETKHSRLPVFREQSTMSRVDLCAGSAAMLGQRPDGPPDTPFVRPVYFIPETKPWPAYSKKCKKRMLIWRW